MTRADVRALVERHWRETHRETVRTLPGGWVEEREGYVFCGAPGSSECVALLAGAVDPDALLAETRRAFGSKGAPVAGFHVVRLQADGPADAVADALLACGYRELHRQPNMVLAPTRDIPPPPPGLDVRPVADEAGRAAFADVVTAAFAVHYAPHESLVRANFPTLDCVAGRHRQAFVGWRDGVPVAAASLYLSHGVAGVGWVAVRPYAARRGFATALTWAVVAEGFRRGARFASLQASAMGEPVYRRMGFRVTGRCRELIREDLYQAFLPGD